MAYFCTHTLQPLYSQDNYRSHNKELPIWIIPHHRIISAIREHIESDEVAVGVYRTIRIKESAYIGIVVSAVEVIEAGFGIVVVTSVTERVIYADSISAGPGGREYTPPCIIDIRYNAGPVGVVDTDYVSLDVGNEQVVIFRYDRSVVCIMTYTYRLTGCIVNIHHEMAGVSFGPFLVKYLRSRKVIYMLYSVYSLARSYTVCVIGISIRTVRHEPSALPCKGAAVPCPGVAHVVICDVCIDKFAYIWIIVSAVEIV